MYIHILHVAAQCVPRGYCKEHWHLDALIPKDATTSGEGSAFFGGLPLSVSIRASKSAADGRLSASVRWSGDVRKILADMRLCIVAIRSWDQLCTVSCVHTRIVAVALCCLYCGYSSLHCGYPTLQCASWQSALCCVHTLAMSQLLFAVYPGAIALCSVHFGDCSLQCALWLLPFAVQCGNGSVLYELWLFLLALWLLLSL